MVGVVGEAMGVGVGVEVEEEAAAGDAAVGGGPVVDAVVQGRGRACDVGGCGLFFLILFSRD